MNDILIAVITAGLAFLGTAVGAYYSNQKTTALVVYRLEQLEEKVNKHNNVIERTYKLETEIGNLYHRYDELRTEIKE